MKAAFEGISNQDPASTAPLPSYPAPNGVTPPLRPAAPATVSRPANAKSQASSAGEVRLDVSNVYKIFSDDPKPALDMLYAGATKDEVFKKLGVTVGVKDASFQVRSGEIFVIMGLSGSGKSTMIRLLNRLIEPSAGKIVFDGRDLVTMSRKELIARPPQGHEHGVPVLRPDAAPHRPRQRRLRPGNRRRPQAQAP